MGLKIETTTFKGPSPVLTKTTREINLNILSIVCLNSKPAKTYTNFGLNHSIPEPESWPGKPYTRSDYSYPSSMPGVGHTCFVD